MYAKRKSCNKTAVQQSYGRKGVRAWRIFEQIYAAYYDAVYGYCLHLTRDPHLAEEVCQEAFFKALKAIDSFHGECKLSVWLCQIAKNTLVYPAEETPPHPGPAPGRGLPDPADLRSALRTRKPPCRSTQALHKLPDPYREVFWLRAFGELSFAQIAALFEKPRAGPGVTYHRARLKLKEELE